jgi:mRNA-degrading endonuclease RelE of RelBE toxin-antitoxin system
MRQKTSLKSVSPRISVIRFRSDKVRVRNSDLQKGKSAGYRLLYYLQTNSSIILITIYSKSDQSDISSAEVRRIVGEVKPPAG